MTWCVGFSMSFKSPEKRWENAVKTFLQRCTYRKKRFSNLRASRPKQERMKRCKHAWTAITMMLEQWFKALNPNGGRDIPRWVDPATPYFTNRLVLMRILQAYDCFIKVCNTLNSHKEIFSILPNQSLYASVFCGTLSVLVQVIDLPACRTQET